MVCHADQAFELGETWLSRGRWERAVPVQRRRGRAPPGQQCQQVRDMGTSMWTEGRAAARERAVPPRRGQSVWTWDQPVSLLRCLFHLLLVPNPAALRGE